MFCTRLAIWLEPARSPRAPRRRSRPAARPHDVGRAALHRHDRLVGVGLDRAHQHLDLLGRVAARSARRCTSSATTAKPRPASPAIEAWIEALSARMLVCSAMSLISSMILPISCELSPRRLMRLLVSWMVSRIVFMPSIVRRTASPPLCATSTECRATSAARSALPETSSMEAAIAAIDSVAEPICLACAPLALARCEARACVWRVAPSRWIAD